ncbi:MAG: hypothetical protein HY703_02780 [Gemmatimonadetes bacterium]|nr:hypothetical protein [Gemmatimonadota bacterium]
MRLVETTASKSNRATATGLAGSFLALLCCAGVVPVLAVVTGIGLGFLLLDAVLIPLLGVALAVTLWGVWQGRRCHGRAAPLALAVVASAVTLGGLFVWVPLAFLGFATVFAAGVFNLLAVRACRVGASLPTKSPR